VTELPDEPAVREHFRKWAEVVNGIFYFGAAGAAEQLASSNAAYAKVLREASKVCMCSFSPIYWGAAQPDWVEIVTWHDFYESYVCRVASSDSLDSGLARAKEFHPDMVGSVKCQVWIFLWGCITWVLFLEEGRSPGWERYGQQGPSPR